VVKDKLLAMKLHKMLTSTISKDGANVSWDVAEGGAQTAAVHCMEGLE
jgi:hypothetical protein